MITAETTTRKIPISEFKAHCTELLRSVENGEPPIQITRHGKVIGRFTKEEDTKPQTVAEWIGSGCGTATFSPDYDPEAPAFDDDEWDMHKE